MTIFFKKINFIQDFDLFLKMRNDVDKEILGKVDYTTDDIKNYVDKNLSQLGDDAFWHIYKNNDLIGQMELGRKGQYGYVNLFYLIKEVRNLGYFKYLHHKMVEIMHKHAVTKVRLSTTLKNRNSIQIYHHYGWVSIGEDEKKPGMLSFELDLKN